MLRYRFASRLQANKSFGLIRNESSQSRLETAPKVVDSDIVSYNKQKITIVTVIVSPITLHVAALQVSYI